MKCPAFIADVPYWRYSRIKIIAILTAGILTLIAGRIFGLSKSEGLLIVLGIALISFLVEMWRMQADYTRESQGQKTPRTT